MSVSNINRKEVITLPNKNPKFEELAKKLKEVKKEINEGGHRILMPPKNGIYDLQGVSPGRYYTAYEDLSLELISLVRNKRELRIAVKECFNTTKTAYILKVFKKELGIS